MLGTWVEPPFLFNLYVYIRLLQLSIDRASENLQEELVNYFEIEGIPCPHGIIAALDCNTKEIKISMLQKSLLRLSSYCGLGLKKHWLPSEDLQHIYKTLSLSSRLFDISDVEIIQQRNEIRLKLAVIEQNLITLLPQRLMEKGVNVQHLHCSNCLQLKKFQQIVDLNFLKYA